jgi:hypothetical protein
MGGGAESGALLKIGTPQNPRLGIASPHSFSPSPPLASTPAPTFPLSYTLHVCVWVGVCVCVCVCVCAYVRVRRHQGVSLCLRSEVHSENNAPNVHSNRNLSIFTLVFQFYCLDMLADFDPAIFVFEIQNTSSLP